MKNCFGACQKTAFWFSTTSRIQAADSPLDDILRIAVESIPPHVKMLCISRVAPPQTFARLRANGQLAVLEPSSIRLTLDEAKGIAALRGHAEEIDVTALNERTDGWVAGLVLMLHGAY